MCEVPRDGTEYAHARPHGTTQAAAARILPDHRYSIFRNRRFLPPSARLGLPALQVATATATATFLVRARRRAQLRCLGLSAILCAGRPFASVLTGDWSHCSLLSVPVATTVLVGGSTSDGIYQQQKKKNICIVLVI